MLKRKFIFFFVFGALLLSILITLLQNTVTAILDKWIEISALVAIPIILWSWGEERNRIEKEKEESKESNAIDKKEQEKRKKIDSRLEEYRPLLKKFFELIKTKLPPTPQNRNSLYRYPKIEEYLRNIVAEEEMRPEILKLLVHLKAIDYKNGCYKVAMQPAADDFTNESHMSMHEYFDSIILDFDNNKYDDSIKEFIENNKLTHI